MSFARILTAVLILLAAVDVQHPEYHKSVFRTVAACPEIVPRADWDAAPAVQREALTSLPVPFVVIHHTFKPGFCNSSQACKAAMKSMQNFHQNTRHWDDIGYQ
jgi:N-acetylmuramoyl-L-alanine amidase